MGLSNKNKLRWLYWQRSFQPVLETTGNGTAQSRDLARNRLFNALNIAVLKKYRPNDLNISPHLV